jgi:hypothetical protein
MIERWVGEGLVEPNVVTPGGLAYEEPQFPQIIVDHNMLPAGNVLCEPWSNCVPVSVRWSYIVRAEEPVDSSLVSVIIAGVAAGSGR